MCCERAAAYQTSRVSIPRLTLVVFPFVILCACASIDPLSMSLQEKSAAVASSLVREQSDWLSHNIPEGDVSSTAPLYSIDAIKIPLKVLLFTLAKEANLELLLDGDYATPVTLSLADKSMEFILDSLTRQAPVRWQLKDGLLEVFADTPYLHSYTVDYLNITRQSNSSVGLATQVGSINLDAESGSSGSGFSNNSQSLIQNESHHEFWESLMKDLQMITASKGEGIVVNRDTGLVSVRTTTNTHQEIALYLKNVQRIASRQVLIEATVVEVALSDQFQAGIDWRALTAGGQGINFAQVLHGEPDVNSDSVELLTRPTALLTAIHQSNSLGRITATLDLLQAFGTVKILSRPQIIAINNQSAVLKVVDNRVYFTMNVERLSRDGIDDVTTSTEIHTVPVGLVMSVTPYVAADASVILNVRPTISRILGFVNDPNPELAAANVENGVPEIQVREMESVLKVGSGQIVMIGGLMQYQRNSDESGIPGLSDIPLLGRLLRHQKISGRKTELLVFLQPTVLNDSNLVAASGINEAMINDRMP